MRLVELDVVNDCLSTMGESPVNTVQVDHPLVTVARRFLKEANARVQSSGWWFNREVVTLYPDEQTANIMLPNDFLAVDPSSAEKLYVQRGNRLYDIKRSSVYFDSPVDVSIVRLVPFQDLPWTAQDLVRSSTLVKFLQAYDADEIRIQQVQSDYVMAFRECQNEHTRFMRPNVLLQGGVAQRRASLRVTGGRHRGLRTR